MTNYQFYSPIATTVKAVYVQAGDKVPAGKLLIALDDMEARAQVASAESGVKSAQAALDAATHNGTQAERQASAGEIAQDTPGARPGAAQSGRADQTSCHRRRFAERSRGSAARLDTARGQPECGPAERAPSLFAGRGGARASRAGRCASRLWRQRSTSNRRPRFAPRSPEPSTAWTPRHRNLPKPATCCCRWPICATSACAPILTSLTLGDWRVGQPIVIQWDAKPGVEWHGHIDRACPLTVVTYTTRNVGEVLVRFRWIAGRTCCRIPMSR